MKKLIIALLTAVPLGLHAQDNGFDKLIGKYENRPGITAVNLEGNILDGITYFLSQIADSDKPESDDPLITECQEGEECVCEARGDETGDAACAAPDEDGPNLVGIVVAETDEDDEEESVDYAGYNEYEYVYGETGDYDYGDEDDIDYSGYYNPYPGFSDYLGMFKTYFDGLTYFKAIVYENPSKKFANDVQKNVVSEKPYKCVVSMRTGGEEIRFYVIDDQAGGQCEILAIVKDDNKYVAVNILGSRDFGILIDALKEFM